MSKRLVLITLLFVYMLASCAPLTGTPPAPVTESVTLAPGTDTPATDTAAPPFIEPIPVHVGYGGRGSWFEIYFTDPTNAVSKQESGGIEEAVIASIDAARLSVDAAFYSLSLREIANALLRARDRGVQVRIVMESDNRDGSVPQALIDAGLPILGDRRQGLMHDKFIVIDRSEVWTGSMNYTTNGVYDDNNNLIHLRSVKIAENYETEFNEMYVNDLFGPDVLAATPNPHVTVDGMDVETYFSPDDGVANHILELVNGAQSSIYFLAYSFTSDDIGQAMRDRATAGVTVTGVMESDQVASNQGTEFDPFRQAGLDVRLDGNSGLMHHKVIIIDRSIVIAGSYNFTASAENQNDENVVIFFSPFIAEWYMAEFERVFGVAKLP